MLSFFTNKKEREKVLEYDMTVNDITFKIKEEQTNTNNYITITQDDYEITYELAKKKNTYQVQNIEYEKNDDYICIYPILKTNENINIYCRKDDVIYTYEDFLKEFDVENKQEENFPSYKKVEYIDDQTETLKKDSLVIYRNNLEKNHYLAVEGYKGLYLINTNDVYKKIELFNNDSYKKELTYFNSKKYITADYNQSYSFNEFYVIDITNGKESKIISDTKLELDAYFMGSVGSKVYMYEKDTKKQYSINLKNNSISTTGNQEKGIQIYENGEFKNTNSYDAYNTKLTFNEYKITDEIFQEYDRVDQIEDTYYLYQKAENSYKVYKSYKKDLNTKIYLFETTNIENIVYQDDYIYYINKQDICYYKKDLGIKTIVTYKELEYNKTLKFGLYIS
jgi:hypothetical protein